MNQEGQKNLSTLAAFGSQEARKRVLKIINRYLLFDKRHFLRIHKTTAFHSVEIHSA